MSNQLVAVAAIALFLAGCASVPNQVTGSMTIQKYIGETEKSYRSY